MTPDEAAHVRTLARYLDRVCLVRWPARDALSALVAAASAVEVDQDPAPRGPEYQPGDVVVSLDLGPALLDPAGQIVR